MGNICIKCTESNTPYLTKIEPPAFQKIRTDELFPKILRKNPTSIMYRYNGKYWIQKKKKLPFGE